MKKGNANLGYFFVIMFIFNLAANFVHPVTPAIIVDQGLNDYMFGLALAVMSAFNFLFSPSGANWRASCPAGKCC